MKLHIKKHSPDIPESIQNALKKFEQEYNNQLRMDHPLLKPIFRHLIGSTGKRVRPMLFFLFQAMFNTSSNQHEIIPVILEMLHEATLIHDDVIDDSSTRRGRASLNAKFSNKVSVLCGDYLMAKVLELGIATEREGLMEIISRTAVNMGLGELRQAVSGPSDSTTESAYFQTINDKTAGLFSAACELGCLAGGSDAGMQTYAAEFGRLYGTVFQIRDDILDYNGFPKSMGKPVGQDLADGNATLPLILAMKNSSRKEKQEIYRRLEQGDKKDCEWLYEFVISHNGTELAQVHGEKIAEQALDVLTHFPECEYTGSLHTMVSIDMERQK